MSKHTGNQNARKADADKCTAMIKVMVTAEEKARIKAMAEAVGLTMKAYLLQGK